MEENSNYLVGKVLDFGAGNQPYRDLVKGEYCPFDVAYSDSLLEPPYDVIMCNQVLEYVPDPRAVIRDFYLMLKSQGTLVMTYPTLWEEVEPNDYWRFTKSGIEKLLGDNAFIIVKHELRCQLEFEDFNLAIGYGMVAKKY